MALSLALPFNHCYFILISPFPHLEHRGPICFFRCNSVHKAPSISRTLRGKPLASKEQETFSRQRENVFNSEGAVGSIPVELIVTWPAVGSGWERASDRRWGMQCSLCVNNCLGNVFPSSEKKFCSGTGWPAFSEAHGTSGSDESSTGILRRVDISLGLVRTEVVCKQVSSLSSPMLPPVPHTPLVALAYLAVTGAHGSPLTLLPIPPSHASGHCRWDEEPSWVAGPRSSLPEPIAPWACGRGGPFEQGQVAGRPPRLASLSTFSPTLQHVTTSQNDTAGDLSTLFPLWVW